MFGDHIYHPHTIRLLRMAKAISKLYDIPLDFLVVVIKRALSGDPSIDPGEIDFVNLLRLLGLQDETQKGVKVPTKRDGPKKPARGLGSQPKIIRWRSRKRSEEEKETDEKA